MSECIALASLVAVYNICNAHMQVSFGGNQCTPRVMCVGKKVFAETKVLKEV